MARTYYSALQSRWEITKLSTITLNKKHKYFWKNFKSLGTRGMWNVINVSFGIFISYKRVSSLFNCLFKTLSTITIVSRRRGGAHKHDECQEKVVFLMMVCCAGRNVKNITFVLPLVVFMGSSSPSITPGPLFYSIIVSFSFFF